MTETAGINTIRASFLNTKPSVRHLIMVRTRDKFRVISLFRQNLNDPTDSRVTCSHSTSVSEIDVCNSDHLREGWSATSLGKNMIGWFLLERMLPDSDAGWKKGRKQLWVLTLVVILPSASTIYAKYIQPQKSWQLGVERRINRNLESDILQNLRCGTGSLLSRLGGYATCLGPCIGHCWPSKWECVL